MRHCRGRRLGLLVGLAMTLSATEARDMPTGNQERPSIVNVSNTTQCVDGFLSVQARDVAVTDLLNQIATQCGLSVQWYVVLADRLSVEFHRLTLTQGLQRILRNRSYLLLSAPSMPGKQPATIARVETLWILPQGDEKSSTQLSMPTTKSTPSFLADAAALSNGNLDDRTQAALALGKRGQAHAVAPLSQALADRNVEVREAAIGSLAEIGNADATRALGIALRDRDPHVREQAVDALGQAGGMLATGLLQQALMDETGFVRQAAIEMLEQLSGAAQ